MNKKTIWISFLGLALLLAFTSCTRDKVGSPSPTGPSTFALVLKVSANPNVIVAGSSRQATTLTANLKNFDGTPVVGRTVYFAINDADNNKISVGRFEGNVAVPSRITDGGGNAYITYFGPLKSEISSSGILHLWASVAMEGSNFVEDYARIEILR
ncbi:MAG: Ig-like domain-containing protein [Candidatus Aminicenantales bacterium]